MTAEESRPGAAAAGGVPGPLSVFAGTGVGDALGEIALDVFAAFGQAMAHGQLLEWATGLVEPAATAPADDDEASSAAVAAGLGRSFFMVIRVLKAMTADGALELPDGLAERLDDARQVRNHLAHRWVWDGGMRTVAGDGPAVIAELTAHAETFSGLIDELFAAVFATAITARGITLAEFSDAAAGLAAGLVARPDPAEGVSFPTETDVFASRIVDAAEEETEL